MSAARQAVAGTDTKAATAQAFAAGDYAGVAMFGDRSTWQHHAGRALCTGEAASLAALRDCQEPAARLHLAAAHWIHGDTAAALRLLADLRDEPARNLAALLQRRIRVLCQLPWLKNTTTDLLHAARHDPHFELRNIGHGAGDVENRPYADVGRFLDAGFAPDLYLAAMVEWQHLPPNLQSLRCPLFGHVADHDLHVQTITPWLSLFDELCVTDRTEWRDVRPLAARTAAVSSFPHVFGLPDDLPPVPGAARHLDFFVSGTMLDPYHPDKAVLLHELLSMPGIDLRVVQGFASQLAFYALLAASKASFTFVRRPGAMPTRGLESLAMGCAVALQRESVLNLWVGEQHGVTTYGPGPGELAAAVQRLCREHAQFGPAAARGAELVRREFALPRTASRYLRYLAFRAALPRGPRALQDTSAWCQKRVSIARAWMPSQPVVRRRTMQANFRQLGVVCKQAPSAAVLVDMARELLCAFVHYAQKRQAGPDERALFDDAVRLLETACRRWPDRLVPQFVLVRALWHHGCGRQRAEALQRAFDCIDGDAARWQVAVDEDVLPFDFHPELFHHRAYLDRLAAAHKGEAVTAAELVRLLSASLAGYVARKTDVVAHHERAVADDPGFARYGIDLARALLARDAAGDAQRAEALLATLAAGSTEFGAAARLLHERAVAAAPPDAPPALPLVLRRLAEDTIDASVAVERLFDVERRQARAAAVVGAADVPAATGPGLALLVPLAGSERQLAALLTDLEGQTMAAALEVVVAVPTGDTRLRAMAATAGAGLAVRCIDVPPNADFADRTNRCVGATAAPLLGWAMPGDRFRPDACQRLVDELQAHPQAVLAFGNEGWVGAAQAHFDPSACWWLACLPRFGPERLVATNAIGLHPVWRRDLHDLHGWFDGSHGAAAEYEFWWRALRTAPVRQLPTLLVTSEIDASWRGSRDPRVEPAAVLRARERRLGQVAAAALPPFVPQRPLPAVLFAPGIAEEAQSQARLGILADEQRHQAAASERFYTTALMHGDHGIAECLLRALAARQPSLLSAHLALASLLEALGRPGAEDVLAAAAHHLPHAALLAARRHALQPMVPPAVPTAVATPTQEFLPCPV
jgi:hypothetical protein